MNESRTSKSIKNAQVSLIYYFIQLILGFFSRKVFFDYLGSEILGLNTTASNLLGFLNLAELGMFFKYTTLKECLVKKGQRLLLPYLFYWVFSRIVDYFGNGLVTHNWNVTDLDFDLLSGGALWFLISLWTIHVICTLGCKIGQAKWLMYSILFGIGLVMGYKEIRLPFYLSQTMLMLPFFLIGLWFYRSPLIKGSSCYEYLKLKSIISWEFLLSLIVFFIPCGFLDINGPVIPNPLQYILTPLSGIMIVLIVSKRFAVLLEKIKMDKVGRNSMQVLGVHAPFVPIIT